MIGLVADPANWHQLDHYTAVTLALDYALNPIGVILQQHNYLRTYLLGRDLDLPADGHLQIIAAMDSNELYPYQESRSRHRAVSFMTPENLRYLVTGKDKPLFAADDITDPAHEVEYRLDFLPPTDAFYMFQGYLGEHRWLPGRDGPPGADYNTRPVFKPRTVQLIAFNWREGDLAQMERLIEFLKKPSQQNEAFSKLVVQFHKHWANLHKERHPYESLHTGTR